jgi:hypothetical protein
MSEPRNVSILAHLQGGPLDGVMQHVLAPKTVGQLRFPILEDGELIPTVVVYSRAMVDKAPPPARGYVGLFKYSHSEEQE